MSIRAPDDSIYDCSICLCLPSPNGVVQCQNGHLFCGQCLQAHRSSGISTSSRCPICRVSLPKDPIRCLAAEKAIASMPSACAHCFVPMTRGDLVAHHRVCPKMPQRTASEACSTPRSKRTGVIPRERTSVDVLCTNLRDQVDSVCDNMRAELLSQLCIQAYRNCLCRPPGAGFRLEMVRSDADLSDLFGLGPSEHTSPSASLSRLLCLVPGLPLTDWEGGHFPVLISYKNSVDPPHCFVPPYEGPHEARRTVSVTKADGSTASIAASFMHVNTYPDGKIGLSTLRKDKGWHPSISLAEVLLCIQIFLDSPNVNEPAQEAAYRLLCTDKAAYRQRVREQAARYTAEEFDKLVLQHCFRPVVSSTDSEQRTLVWTEDGEHRIIRGQ